MANRSFIVLCLLGYAGTIFPTAQPIQLWGKTHASFVGQKNLESLVAHSENWSCRTLEEYATILYQRTNNPTPMAKRNLILNIFKSHQAALGRIADADKTNEQVSQDLTLLCGQSHREHYVAKVAFPTITDVGLVNTCLMLTKPTTDTAQLTSQQELISAIVHNEHLQQTLETALQLFAKHEHVLACFWNEQTHIEDELHRNIFFNKDYYDFLNTNADALECLRLADLGKQYVQAGMQTVACGALGVYGLCTLTQPEAPEFLERCADRYSGNAGILCSTLRMINQPTIKSLVAIAASTICGHYAIETLIEIRGHKAYADTIGKIAMQTAQSIRALHNLLETLNKHGQLNNSTCRELLRINNSKAMQQFFTRAHDRCFDTEEAATKIASMGTALAFLKHVFNLKPLIQIAVTKLGYIDTMTACAKNLITMPTRWCIPTFATNSQPHIIANNFWHPLITKNPIPSSITLGVDGHRPHAVITGPNEGGKSTTMKAIALAVLCAQTVGVCPAESFTLTPFSYIKTYLNINDDIGAGNSLFRAEFERAQQLLDTISNAPPSNFGLFVFDEMCSGTSPIEGAAAAYIIAKRLSSYDNCLCLVATHFANLTNLEFDTTTFKNFNVKAIQNHDGSFSYPRTLEAGPSTQHIALDILRNEGFAGSLIDEARDIVKNMGL